MSTPLILGALWVIASAVVAMLPMRAQMVPGVALLIAAPILLVWIGWVHGWVWLALGLFAFVSMFRNPLRYFARRALGRPAPLPKELEK
jgi:signal transduction histidine kinase